MKKHLLSTAVVLCCALSGLSAERTDDVLKQSGFAGGVVVHLDCGCSTDLPLYPCIQYLNVGGYPAAVFSEEIQNDIERFIKSDIIDKVLLRDLPQLYGIRDIRELDRLFTTLAYNTGNEVSLEELSRSFHNTSIVENLHYAWWPSGEIDLVLLDQKTQKPRWATEVKWSDRPATDKRLMKHLVSFQGKNPDLKSFEVTTKTIHSKGSLPDGTPLELVPTAIAVYEVGRFALNAPH